MNTLLLFIFILSAVYVLVTIWEHCAKEKHKQDEHYNLYKVYFRKGEDVYTEIVGASCEEHAEEIFYESVETNAVELLKIEVFHIRDLTDED